MLFVMGTSLPLNYFELLGISPQATAEEIREAYLDTRAAYQSQLEDMSSPFDRSDIDTILQLLEEAYVILTHSSLRELYLSKLRRGFNDLIPLDDLKKEHLTNKNKKSAPISLNKTKIDFEIFDGPTIKSIRDRLNISIDELSQITKGER